MAKAPDLGPSHDTANSIRHRALYSMAQGNRPSQYDMYFHEPSSSSCSPRRSWDGQKGREGAGQGPPPGSRAVSAYSSSNQTHQAEFAQSTLNLVTCVLGAGALGYPFCFKECGLLLATIIMFATLVATRISYQLLLYCAQLSGLKSYESIAEHALGKTGRQIVELCIAAMNLGALVAFLDILADVLSAVAGTIIPPGAEPSRHAYITGVTLVGALPVSLLVREPSVIANMSNAAVVFVVVFAVVVFCTAFGPSAAAALGVRWAALTHVSRVAAAASAVRAPVLHMWNPQGVLVSLPVMAYGFTAHQYYMGIYTMLKAPSVRKMKLVTDTALLVCAGVYWTVGVGGYATFGDRTAGDIIRNFGGQRSVGMWGAYERALKLCYGMAVLGNIPLVILPFSSILAPLLPGDEKLKQQTSSLTSVCTVAGAKRATAAAFSACSGSGSGAAAHKARCSGSGTGSREQLFSDGGFSCAGGELAVHLDAEALLLEAPTWHHQHSKHDQQDTTSTSKQWQKPLSTQQQQQQQRQQQHAQHSLPEQQPLLSAERPASPEEAPEHPHLTQEACRAAHLLTGPQHSLVVILVLGLGLASAVWLPNVELIFGLTGSTASVLAAFIMPALCFLRLYEQAPELGSGRRSSGGGGGGSVWRAFKQAVCCCCGAGTFLSAGRSRSRASGARQARYSSPGAQKRQHPANGSWAGQPHSNGDGSHSPSKVWGPVLVVPELRAQWACRQRLAFLLLAFGLISGLLCTDAILSSISEEKAVVQLAQELVAHEAVVAETSRAQQKAKEAAAAVDAVSSAAQQLGAVDTATNNTLGSLTAAAAALNTIAAPKDGTGSIKGQGGSDRQQQPSVWDLKGRIEQHKQKVAEDSVLRNVEAALSIAAADITATTASVTAVIIKLDTSIAQIKADAASASAPAAAAAVKQPTHGSKGSGSAAGPARDGSSRVQAPDGSVVVLPAADTSGSTFIVPHGDSEHAQEDQQQQQQEQPPPVVPAGASEGSKSAAAPRSSSSDAYARANEMAKELGKALGAFGQGAAGANLTLTAGRSLEQVRDSAISALTALNITADVLRQVRHAVATARHAQQRDSQVKELAVLAMQRALNATAASALAMRITREALGTAATEESSELLTALTRVAQDLEKSDSTTGGKKRTSVTVSSDDVASGAGSRPGSSSDAAAAGAAPGGAKQDAGSASDPVTGPSSGGAGVTAAGVPAGSSSGAISSSHSSSTSSSTSSKDTAPEVQPPTAQPQAKHPTLAEHEAAAAAAAAAANAAAHAESESTTHQPGQQGEQQQQHPSATETGVMQSKAPAAEDAKDAPSKTASVEAAVASAAANAAAHADAATPAAQAQQQQQEAIAGGPASQPGVIVSVGGSADSSSGSSTAAGSTSGTTAAGKPVLTDSEASKIKDIIGHLASALSAGSGGAQATPAANITQLAAAIHDAVTWTQQSKSAVLGLIVQDLGKTDPKVAQRVMGIVQEVSTTESEADRQKEQQDAVAAAAAAVGAATANEGGANKQHEPQQTAKGAPGHVQEHTQTQQHQQQADGGRAVVAGPVVAVTADGTLQQQSGAASATEGPVVPEAQADTAGAKAETTAASTPQPSDSAVAAVAGSADASAGPADGGTGREGSTAEAVGNPAGTHV